MKYFASTGTFNNLYKVSKSLKNKQTFFAGNFLVSAVVQSCLSKLVLNGR